MKLLLFSALLLAATPAFAFDIYRAGSHLLHLNDSEGDLLTYMGDSDSKQPVENKLGAHIGDYYFYSDHGKTVRFFVSGGLIVEIVESRH